MHELRLELISLKSAQNRTLLSLDLSLRLSLPPTLLFKENTHTCFNAVWSIAARSHLALCVVARCPSEEDEAEGDTHQAEL